MQFFILVLIVCLFVFLYCMYLLGNDDFIFLRRDLSMERIFNYIFLGSLVCLFFSRLFFGLFNGNYIFSNVLAFLMIPYFPGLSLLGAVVGAGVVFIYLGLKHKDIPLERLADFSSIAFLITLPIGFLGYLMFAKKGPEFIETTALIVTYLILFVIFLRFFLPRLLNGKIKEGTITFLFLFLFSIITLLANAYPKENVLSFLKNPENSVGISIAILSIILLFRDKVPFLSDKKTRR